jgi:peptidoglycan/xylan/chitin deacetylase (PgdA/CDA1 family)
MSPIHLAYHYVLPEGERALSKVLCTTSQFRDHCTSLRDCHASVKTVGEFAKKHGNGRVRLHPEVTLSFDDGTRDHFEQAFPILKEYGLPATFFVIGCTLDGKLPSVIMLQKLISDIGAKEVEHKVMKQLKGTVFMWFFDPERLNIGDQYSLEERAVRRLKTAVNNLLPHGLKHEIVSNIYTEVYGAGHEERMTRELFVTVTCKSGVWR